MTKVLVLSQGPDDREWLEEGIRGIDPSLEVNIITDNKGAREGQLLLWLSETLNDQEMNTLTTFCMSYIRGRLKKQGGPQHLIIRGREGSVLKSALLGGVDETPKDRTSLDKKQPPPRPLGE